MIGAFVKRNPPDQHTDQNERRDNNQNTHGKISWHNLDCFLKRIEKPSSADATVVPCVRKGSVVQRTAHNQSGVTHASVASQAFSKLVHQTLQEPAWRKRQFRHAACFVST